MKLFIIILGLLSLILINLYHRKKTLREIDQVIEKAEWKKTSKREYLKKCYNLVVGRFGDTVGCWYKFPWRNFYYCNLWKRRGKGLPCHMFLLLFHRCLRKKFTRQELKIAATTYLRKKMLIHFYSKVRLNKNWINIDVWGKKKGIPFGKRAQEVS